MEIVKKTEDYSIYISSHKFPDEMCDLAINIFKDINKTNPSRIDNDTTAPKIALARKDKQLFLDEQNRANNFSIDNEVCNEDISESVNSPKSFMNLTGNGLFYANTTALTGLDFYLSSELIAEATIKIYGLL